MKKGHIVCFLMHICMFLLSIDVHAVNYYFNDKIGNDANDGKKQQHAFKTLRPIQQLTIQSGDTLFFARGQKFSGGIVLKDILGVLGRPIVLTAYGADTAKPIIDAGEALYALHLRNVSFVYVSDLAFTAETPYRDTTSSKDPPMRCGVLMDIVDNNLYETITLDRIHVYNVFLLPKGSKRNAAEVRTANGTQGYGWGIRFINSSKSGQIRNVVINNTIVHNVSHTGIKFTAPKDGIQQVEIANCLVYETGGPGMQFSGLRDTRIHHNHVHHSGSTADSRNWGRGSGMWTWSCRNILVEYNRFENANGPGDSAGVHIDYNCADVVVQYNFSANNAGGFCEILGNNYNCAYRYNISVNDGFRIKGENGAFQEGKVFWLSGYQGDTKKNFGPFNSYFYNNTMYVSKHIQPKIAMASSAKGVLIANNIFCFENPGILVSGDQKKHEQDLGAIPNVVFSSNLFLRADNWPINTGIVDSAALVGDPRFVNMGGLSITDYMPKNKKLIANRGMVIPRIPNDSIGLSIGLHVQKDILGNKISGKPDIGAIEIKR